MKNLKQLFSTAIKERNLNKYVMFVSGALIILMMTELVFAAHCKFFTFGELEYYSNVSQYFSETQVFSSRWFFYLCFLIVIFIYANNRKRSCYYTWDEARDHKNKELADYKLKVENDGLKFRSKIEVELRNRGIDADTFFYNALYKKVVPLEEKD